MFRYLTVAVEVALAVAVVIVITALAAHADAPVPICSPHLGAFILVGILAAMAGASFSFVAAGLFASSGRDP